MRTVCSLAVVGIAGFIVGVLVMAGCGGRNAETPRAQAADGTQTATRKILISRPMPGDTASIYAINPDGTGLRRLTNTPGAWDSCPSWSPDSTRIAFSRSGELWVMNADGTQARKVYNGGGEEPGW